MCSAFMNYYNHARTYSQKNFSWVVFLIQLDQAGHMWVANITVVRFIVMYVSQLGIQPIYITPFLLWTMGKKRR